MSKVGLIAACAVTAVFLSGFSARAGALDVQYAVSLGGLSLGTASLKGTITPKSYNLHAAAALGGLAGMVTGGRGAATAQGAIDGKRVAAGSYSVTAANSEMTRTIQMAISGGSVTQAVINPPLDPKPDRVAVTPAHKSGVIDPLAALVMTSAAGNPQEACNRTLQIFDGAQRFNIQLSYAGSRNVAAQEGYAGPVLICKARYTPIAGHREGRPAVKFMTENRDMETWLAPTGVAGVYVPFRVAVKTQVGTSVLQATRYVYEQSETTASIPPKR